MQDPDSESHTVEPKNDFIPATADQLRTMIDFVREYSNMCENVTSNDIWNTLKSKYNFTKTSDLSSEMADKIIKQVEYWYKKKKEA